MMPNGVLNELERNVPPITFSSEALRVFDSASGGGLIANVPPEENRNNAAHREYNRNVSRVVRDYLTREGINPATMTEQGARDLIREINRDPKIYKFNRQMMGRALQRGIRAFTTGS